MGDSMKYTNRLSIDTLIGNEEDVSIIEKLDRVCSTEKGVLLLINLDNFSLFTDIYGQETASSVLNDCARIISENTEADDVKGNLGGGGIVKKRKNMDDKKAFAAFYKTINDELEKSTKKILGEDANIMVGASVGGVFVPDMGTSYDDLFHKADMALEYVKQTGTHGCALYNLNSEKEEEPVDQLESISRGLDEYNVQKGALWLDYDYFCVVYRFMRRYIKTYKGSITKVLVTVTPNTEIPDDEFVKITKEFGEILNVTLRKSDVMMQSRRNQFFVLLPQIEEKYIESVCARIMECWSETPYYDISEIDFEAEKLDGADEQ